MALPFLLLGSALGSLGTGTIAAGAAATVAAVAAGMWAKNNTAAHPKNTNKQSSNTTETQTSPTTSQSDMDWNQQIQSLADKLGVDLPDYQPPATVKKDYTSPNTIQPDMYWSQQIQSLADKLATNSSDHQPPATVKKDDAYWSEYNRKVGEKVRAAYKQSIENIAPTSSNNRDTCESKQIKNIVNTIECINEQKEDSEEVVLFANDINADKRRASLLQEHLEFFIKAAGYTIREFEVRFDLPHKTILSIINKDTDLSILQYLAFGSFVIENSNLTSKCLVDASILAVLINCLVENDKDFSPQYKNTMSNLLKTLSSITEFPDDNSQETAQKIRLLIVRLHNQQMSK